MSGDISSGDNSSIHISSMTLCPIEISSKDTYPLKFNQCWDLFQYSQIICLCPSHTYLLDKNALVVDSFNL